MDTNSGSNHNGTTINNSTSGSSSRPPSWVWVLVALASALTVGIVLYGVYQFIIRRRRKRLQVDDAAEGDALATRGGGGGSTTRRPWDRRRRRSRSQPGASRWGWVYPHSNNRASTQSSEGLNELGEAPPPYNEDDLEPCLNMSMVEVGGGLGEGPSRVASRQDRASRVGDLNLDLEEGQQRQQQQLGHPEPPAYDFAVNLGGTTASVQPPPPAIVVSEARVT
jgi:hypothetical protein